MFVCVGERERDGWVGGGIMPEKDTKSDCEMCHLTPLRHLKNGHADGFTCNTHASDH